MPKNVYAGISDYDCQKWSKLTDPHFTWLEQLRKRIEGMCRLLLQARILSGNNFSIYKQAEKNALKALNRRNHH